MSMIEYSDLPDPLRQYSLPTLFPRTFADLPRANNSDDLESVHNFIRTEALKCPNQHFDKANQIVQGISAPPGSKPVNNDEAVTKCNGNPQERRPALGRKRARFSLKPDEGRPTVSLESNLEIDKLQDPEEFFSAYHKLEYAREEIERQTGGNMTGKNEYNPSANPRRRRPSILGKAVNYKHNNYSSAILKDVDTVIASQETLQQENLSPSKFGSQETSIPDVELQERELSGSVSNSEKIGGRLLDELLSRDIDNLDGGGAVSLLQERLQIKAVDLDKYLHDFSQLEKVDSMDLAEEMSMSRKPLSDIQNVVSGLNEKNPLKHKHVKKDQNYSIVYSTSPKRPSVVSSSWGRHSSKSKPFHFSFSPDPGLSPSGSPTLEYLNRRLNSLGTRKELSIPVELKSQVEDESTNTACASSDSKKVIPGELCNCLENTGSINSRCAMTDMDTRTNGYHGDLVNKNESKYVGGILCEDVPSTEPHIDDDDLSRGHSDTIVQAHVLTKLAKNVTMHVLDIQQEASFTQPNVDIGDSTAENLIASQSQLGLPESIVTEADVMDRQPANAESGLEQQKEECPKSSPKDRRKPARSRGLQESKALSRRQSLAAAGTCWKSGVRRSNRIKMKPLEYWKGERVLYGRVHESLATVIGVKCISSPTSGHKERKFRVTSYVSDEHKELVDLAALH